MREISEGALPGGRPIWPIVLRRWRLALVIALVLFLASYFYIKRLTPIYTASVQVVLPFSSLEDPAGRKGAQIQTDMFVVRGYADIVQDDALCLKIIDALKLGDLPEFNLPPSLLAKLKSSLMRVAGANEDTPSFIAKDDLRRGTLLSIYKGLLKAKNDNKSLILNISFSATDPYLAQQIVNRHVAAFIEAQIAYRRNDIAIKAKWMKDEADIAANEMRDAQNAIQLYAQHFNASVQTAALEASELRFRQVLASSKQSVYETLLTRFQDLMAETQYIGSDIRLVSPATVPIRPSFPKPMLFALAAAFASLLVGFAASTLITFIRDARPLEEIASEAGVPCLGRLEIRRRSRVCRLQTRTRRLASFWDAIRGIRSKIGTRAVAGGQVLMVTSSTSSEGKSLLAASLARSIAASGTRTLLLDLNFRRVSFYAPLSMRPNLQDFFQTGLAIDQLYVPLDTSVPLYFLGHEQKQECDDILDTFGGKRLKELIAAVRRDFDYIVVDVPPVGRVADALFVADLADETVLVAMSGRATKALLLDAIAALRGRKAALVGVVIADSRKPKSTVRHVSSAKGKKKRGFAWPDPRPPRQTRPPGPMVADDYPIAFARTMAKRLP